MGTDARSFRRARVPLLPVLLAQLLTPALAAAPRQTAAAADRAPASSVRLSREGWFRLADGRLYLPLGGFHANVLPLSRLRLDPQEFRRIEPHIWSAQKTDGQGHVDLFDAPDETLREWFTRLASHGVTALRLFPRARVGTDVLDLCGKLNPELKAAFERAFRAARPHNIRFLLQILPEPGRTCYMNPAALERHVRPRYSASELAALPEAQAKFLLEGKRVALRDWFTDPDVLACQKQYLAEALEWVRSEPQIFALEIYNEQGWSTAGIEGQRQHVYTFPWMAEEIRWTAEIVRAIKQRLPQMPVTISHPGFGVTGYDPLEWSRATGVDFYSTHMYAGLCGENEEIDFAAVTGATGLIIGAGLANFNGEWGVLNSTAPEDIRRLSHRDAIWLSLLGGQGGFMQWTYEFPEEYRWPSKVFRALPAEFSPAPPGVSLEISEAYRAFQDNSRYPLFQPAKLFPAFPFNRQKQQDQNLRSILRAYRRSLELGAPIRFSMNSPGTMTVDQFMSPAPESLPRPVQAIGGYQLAYLEDRALRVWVGYLRSRQVRAYGRHYLGVPVQAPLRLKLDLPRDSYTFRLIDLSAGTVRTRNVKERAAIHIACHTSADFAFLIAPRPLRIVLD